MLILEIALGIVLAPVILYAAYWSVRLLFLLLAAVGWSIEKVAMKIWPERFERPSSRLLRHLTGNKL